MSRDSSGRSERPLEWWGGVEYTVNRVQDAFHDQLSRSRHLQRVEDIDRFADLGLSALRMPVLWEHAQVHRDDEPHLEPVSAHLERARSHDIQVIAGLVHHGSGPRHTGLLQPDFAPGLAEFAARVAERFPWLTCYTPVNEPLTTARFSGLYGHWYPHLRSTRACFRMLVHQCRATVLAMEAIRRIQPAARLLQTEDVGTTFASPGLTYQSDYENLRRFLSLDLLCGKVDAHHPLRAHLLNEGVSEHELAFFEEHATPPDLIGVNYYVTSDRYLDEHLGEYPVHTHGGNGLQAYADVEAVRSKCGVLGHARTLEAVWQRYGIPMALSEVHMGCTREEQLRWLRDAHLGALAARERGVDLRAITVWALLGSFDWCSLVTRQCGSYEPGAYDVRAPEPRPTAISCYVRAHARGEPFDHPALDSAGWWRRTESPARGARSLLITGGGGLIARTFARACEARALPVRLMRREELDVCDAAAVEDAIRGLRPWAVINAAGSSAPDGAAWDACLRTHAQGPGVLASSCARHGVRLLTLSSDAVFAEGRPRPYIEEDPVAPGCVLGHAKVEGERLTMALAPDALIVRTSAVFAHEDTRSCIARILAGLEHGRMTRFSARSHASPTFAPHLVDVCLDLMIDGATRLWHVVNAWSSSWADLTLRLARLAHKHVHPDLLEASDDAHDPLVSFAGKHHALASARAQLMPSIDDALDRFVFERRRVA